MQRRPFSTWNNLTFEREEVRLSRFEKLAAKHGIGEADWESSAVLKSFAVRNRSLYYVPERLLLAWGPAEEEFQPRKAKSPEEWLAAYRKSQSQLINRT